MNEEEMISEIEIYLSHVIAKDFPFPKAVKLMYEEYKNSNKNWEKIYDEDQNYIVELNNKILDLEFKIKKQQKEIEKYSEIFKNTEETTLYADGQPIQKIIELTNYISKDKIKAKAQELDNQQRQWREDRTNKHTDAQIIYARDVLEELISETND